MAGGSSSESVTAPVLSVLPQWSLPDLPVYAITPRRGEQPAKVRHALALLAAHFDLLPGPAAG